MNINWDDFDSPYWSPDKGRGYELVLAHWRQEWKTYDEEKTEKPVITFDVLKIDKEEFKQGAKVFTTGARSFASQVKPLIERAERRKEVAISVYLEFGTDKKYRLVDLERVRKG